MAELTDALRKRARFDRYKGKVPDWWPAAQIVGAVVLFAVLMFSIISGVGDSGNKSDAALSTLAATVPTNPVGVSTTKAPAPVPSASATSSASSVPASSAQTTPDVSTTPTAGAYPTPTVLGDGKVKISASGGGFRNIEVGAWTAASNYALSVVPGGTVKTGQLLVEAPAIYEITVVVSTAQGEQSLTVTAKRTASGQWIAG